MTFKLVESFEGVVLFDEEEGALLQLKPPAADDVPAETLYHCGALIPGVLAGKTVRVTIEEQVDDTPPS